MWPIEFELSSRRMLSRFSPGNFFADLLDRTVIYHEE